MTLPTTFTWILTPPPEEVFGPLPDPGPPVPSSPMFRRKLFERGIKFANVEGGKAENVIHGGERVYHINSAMNVLQLPIDKSGMNGLIRFRFRSKFDGKLPDKIKL